METTHIYIFLTMDSGNSTQSAILTLSSSFSRSTHFIMAGIGAEESRTDRMGVRNGKGLERRAELFVMRSHCSVLWRLIGQLRASWVVIASKH